ncbi:macrosialin [Salarias fasciatus]|uniref:Macrosialin-like n=1 Tax=Salarias fasciatus TaxID=181472 RepID=A0A672IDS3_SALFA|nr:macrosialin-like [Salarias fasciatus]
MKAAVLVYFALAVLSLTGTAAAARPPATETPAAPFSPNSPTPTPKTTTTTPAHNATTPAHNATTPAHNATTPAHKTTTPAHNATTPAHNTTTPAHNTTTPAHNTTTTPTTTPRPAPTPSANLTVGNYTLMKGKAVCLMAMMALQIRVQTPEANGTFIVQPNKTKTQGGCGDTTANLTLAFKEGFITFLFNKSVADDAVYVNELRFRLSYSFVGGGNADYQADNSSVHLFSARVGHSYSCRAQSLSMGKGLYLDVDQDRMQAFNLTKANEFGTPDHCPADQSDYRVAVGVGVTLLVLIVVVVVVYLLGRRRRTDGYQSL